MPPPHAGYLYYSATPFIYFSMFCGAITIFQLCSKSIREFCAFVLIKVLQAALARSLLIYIFVLVIPSFPYLMHIVVVPFARYVIIILLMC